MSENKSKATSTDNRVRNYAAVVYPESAPDNWRDILTQHHVPAFISPLHDKDVNPAGNEPKKPHYHVMLMFEGKKSIEQAKSIFSSIGGVGCEVVQSLRGYARYLCHLDNPEKAQYNAEQVTSFCGADYMGTIGLAIDKYKAIAEMEEFCERVKCTSYSLLSKYARMHRPDWYRMLCDCASVHMREYLKSHAWTLHCNMRLIDPETGEDLLS